MGATGLAVFDFDATLIKNETLDTIAASFGIGDKVAAITRDAMGGTVDFHSALIRRVQLLRGMPMTAVMDAIGTMEATRGAAELAAALKALKFHVVVVSGGFTLATDLFRDRIGYGVAFANELHSDQGVLTGTVGGPAMFSHSKGLLVETMQALTGIGPERTLVCGDGANDLSMFPHAELRVAFGTKGVLDKHANVVIKEHDLARLIPFAESFAGGRGVAA